MEHQPARKEDCFKQPRAELRAQLKTLSGRETQVLSLLAEGAAYKEIGVQLGISIDTVRQHIRSIYSKLKIRSRTEATVKFLRSLQ